MISINKNVLKVITAILVLLSVVGLSNKLREINKHEMAKSFSTCLSKPHNQSKNLNKVKYYEQIQIFNKLKATDPTLSKIYIKLLVNKERGINAKTYSCGPNCAIVELNQGTIDWFKTSPHNKDYTAIILAHELGHVQRGDIGWTNKRGQYCHRNNANSRQCEKDADIYGQQLANKAGYNGCQASNLMRDFLNELGDIEPGLDHPTFKTRAIYLECK